MWSEIWREGGYSWLTASSFWLTKERGKQWLLPGQLLPRLLHFSVQDPCCHLLLVSITYILVSTACPNRAAWSRIFESWSSFNFTLLTMYYLKCRMCSLFLMHLYCHLSMWCNSSLIISLVVPTQNVFLVVMFLFPLLLISENSPLFQTCLYIWKSK